MKKDIWILTEERPKNEVIHIILEKFISDNKISCFIDTIRILPILNDKGDFSFTYKIIGFTSEVVGNVYIKSVSGKSSFVDFLLFYQLHEPKQSDVPLYAIEETKTDDAESRNTGIYQRASKFVYIDFFYPNIKKIMLYSLQIEEKENQTDTNIFGTKCLYTIGVEILGKNNINKELRKFNTVEEVISMKDSMRAPPKGNIPILIKKYEDRIEVSGRLFKDDALMHDPNIGALSLICATLRKLGWSKKIIITMHGLEQRHINGNNKFVLIANSLKIEFEGLNSTIPIKRNGYWDFDKKGEKLGTIFIHIVAENFTNCKSLFENHAGCEKSYFITKEGKHIPLQKYIDRDEYKNGDKTQIVSIPDLVLIDFENAEILNLEGKKYQFRENGIQEIANFDAIENLYIKPNYPEYKILRSVILYGSLEEKVIEIEVSFLLNENGKMVLGVNSPKLFRDALKNLLDYWNKTI